MLFNLYFRPGNTSSSIWMTNVVSSYYDTCINIRNKCPSIGVSSCYHYEDVTVECSKLPKLTF